MPLTCKYLTNLGFKKLSVLIMDWRHHYVFHNRHNYWTSLCPWHTCRPTSQKKTCIVWKIHFHWVIVGLDQYIHYIQNGNLKEESPKYFITDSTINVFPYTNHSIRFPFQIIHHYDISVHVKILYCYHSWIHFPNPRDTRVF